MLYRIGKSGDGRTKAGEWRPENGEEKMKEGMKK
jgi:hypothetical protein